MLILVLLAQDYNLKDSENSRNVFKAKILSIYVKMFMFKPKETAAFWPLECMLTK